MAEKTRLANPNRKVTIHFSCKPGKVWRQHIFNPSLLTQRPDLKICSRHTLPCFLLMGEDVLVHSCPHHYWKQVLLLLSPSFVNYSCVSQQSSCYLLTGLSYIGRYSWNRSKIAANLHWLQQSYDTKSPWTRVALLRLFPFNNSNSNKIKGFSQFQYIQLTHCERKFIS